MEREEEKGARTESVAVAVDQLGENADDAFFGLLVLDRARVFQALVQHLGDAAARRRPCKTTSHA